MRVPAGQAPVETSVAEVRLHPCGQLDARRSGRVTCVGSDSVFGTGCTVRRSSWLGPFPPPTPPMRREHRCSPASRVLRTHLTSHQRACQHCPRRRSLAVPGRRKPGKMVGSPGSRDWSFQACSWSSTPPRGSPPLAKSRHPVLPSPPPQGRHAEGKISELNTWPACTPAVATPAMLPPPAYDAETV